MTILFPSSATGQSTAVEGSRALPAHQEARSSNLQKPAKQLVVTNHQLSPLVLGRDTLILLDSDSAIRSDLWLAYEFETAERWKDAQDVYTRVLPNASDRVRDYAQARIVAVLVESRASKLRWLPYPLRPVVAWLFNWRWRWEAFWLVALGVVAFFQRRAKKAGRNLLRIREFVRQLPNDVGMGIEETIVDVHRRTTAVRAPVGLLLNAGLKLPVISSAPSEELVELAKSVGPSWLPKLVAFILRTSDKPRFVITGRATGTFWAVHIVVGLDDYGRRVRTWDRTVSSHQLIDGER